MSPIFNQHALNGLSDHALRHLRTVLRNALASGGFTDAEHRAFKVMLGRIEAILRRRVAPAPQSTPGWKPPSW